MGKKVFGIDPKELIFLGKGLEGRVFLTPDGNALKEFSHSSLCRYEYRTLKKVEGIKYFPKALVCKGRFLLREYVKGTPIKKYIEENGLSRQLSINLIEFADEFERLNLRVDGITKHIYIQDDESIKAIDLRRKKSYIHLSILRHLRDMGLVEDFLRVLREERPDLELQWSKTISRFI